MPSSHWRGVRVHSRVEMCDLLQRVHAGVGASGAMHDHGFAGNEAGGVREHALDAAPVRLDLPTDEIGAVVLESQCDSSA